MMIINGDNAAAAAADDDDDETETYQDSSQSYQAQGYYC